MATSLWPCTVTVSRGPVRRVFVSYDCSQGEYAEAHRLALEAQASPCGEAEQQGLERLLPRLARKLELPRPELPPTHQPRSRILKLPADRLAICGSVELAVRDAISHPERPVWYVENALITGLFGLLCWEVVFAPLPGAFFHPFQHGPADLRRDDFVARRRRQFDTALARLDDGSYRDVILDHRQRCAGLANPFVHWELLEPELLSLALDCIPAPDLRCMFQRLLLDPAVNRSGLPDLVQFLPGERPNYHRGEGTGRSSAGQSAALAGLAWPPPYLGRGVACRVAS